MQRASGGSEGRRQKNAKGSALESDDEGEFWPVRDEGLRRPTLEPERMKPAGRTSRTATWTNQVVCVTYEGDLTMVDGVLS